MWPSEGEVRWRGLNETEESRVERGCGVGDGTSGDVEGRAGVAIDVLRGATAVAVMAAVGAPEFAVVRGP